MLSHDFVKEQIQLNGWSWRHLWEANHLTFDGEGVCGFENINLQAYLSKQKMFMHTTTVEKEIQTHSLSPKKKKEMLQGEKLSCRTHFPRKKFLVHESLWFKIIRACTKSPNHTPQQFNGLPLIASAVA